MPDNVNRRRLYFADNLRVLLIALVILQHLSITFGGPGDWYVQGETDHLPTEIALTLFNAFNESYLMGLLFLLAGYFTTASHDRKGTRQFVRGRLMRIGLPMLVYDALINPVFLYAFLSHQGDIQGSIWQFAPGYFRDFSIGTGPLWFLQRLLVFSLLYVLWRVWIAKPPKTPQTDAPLPGWRAFLALAVGLSLATFVLRIWLPARTSIEFRGLEFPFFPPQWITMFVLGVIAYRRNWLARLPRSMGRFGLVVSLFCTFVLFPGMFALGGGASQDLSKYMGGPHWQSLAYSVWQQFLGVGMIVFLCVAFRQRVNHSGRLARALGGSSYGAYIIHTPIAVFLGLAIRSLALPALGSLALSAVTVVPLCFLLAHGLRQLPLARRML